MASNFLIAIGCAPDGFTVVKSSDEKYTGNAKLGDLFMVKCGSSGEGASLGYYHAGVYCSEEEQEIIHFTFTSSQKNSSRSKASSKSCSGEGVVSKLNVNVFCGQSRFAIYRKIEGVPQSFKNDVRQAMMKTPQYNLSEYNCIHFALELLHVDTKTTEDYIKRILKIFNNKGTE
ncbi:uncharacterized protein DAT39_007932, partial [Clarias magur]